MKKIIAPVFIPVILFLVVRTMNPDVRAVGIGIVVAFGFVLGIVANSLLFKEKGQEKNLKE